MNSTKKEAFRLIGLKLNHKTSNLNGQSGIDCGNLWQKFEKDKSAEKIPDKMDDAVYAVYFDYDGGHLDPFSYFIGCRVDENSMIPEGMSELKIPAQEYQHVLAKGKMPDCISEAWKQIWNNPLSRMYGFDFEMYDQRSYDWSKAEVDVFVSLKPE